MKLIYIYDILCGWCHIARPEIRRLCFSLPETFEIETCHRRLFTGEHVPVIDESFLKMVHHIAREKGPALTGQTFSEKYFKLIESPDFSHDSHLSAIAVSAAAELLPGKSIFNFIDTIQELIFNHGLNPKLRETYLQGAEQIGLDLERFGILMNDPLIHSKATGSSKTATLLQFQVSSPGVPVLIFDHAGKQLKLNPYNAEKSLEMINPTVPLVK